METSTRRFTIYGLLSFFCYLCFYAIEPLQKALHDYRIVPSADAIYLVEVFLLFLLLGLYYLAYRRLGKDAISFKHVAAFVILFNVAGLFLWPVASHDIFSYINQARVAVVHGSNPYIAIYDDFPGDSFYSVTRNLWSGYATPYLPLYVDIARVLSKLGGDSLFLNFIFFKLSAVIFSLGAFFLVSRTFSDIRPAFLLGWNPLIIFESAINGHNDAVQVFLIAAGIFFLLKTGSEPLRYYLSWIFIALAGFTKLVPLILLPFLYLVAISRLKGKDRMIFALASPAILPALAIILYAPYWDGVATISTLALFSMNVTVAAVASPIISLITTFGLLVPIDMSADFPAMAGKMIFFTSYSFLLGKMYMASPRLEDNDFIRYAAIALVLFPLSFLSYLAPWYLLNVLLCAIMTIGATGNYAYSRHITFITGYGIAGYLLLR